MYIERVPNRNSPPAVLLRESYREGKKIRKRTLANLSKLPDDVIDNLRGALQGGVAFKPEQIPDTFSIIRSRPHGHVAAVLGILKKLNLHNLIASEPSRTRELVLAMIVARIIDPCSKLATARGLNSETCFSSLGEVLGLETADEDELYLAMDWLLERQDKIETELAKRHLTSGSLVLYDLTSTYFEGETCPLANYGYSRDKKKGKLQIVFGLLCDKRGCPIAVEVFKGNTTDQKTLASVIDKVRSRFGISHVIWVGDRGMITQARIREDLKETEGLDWITALTKTQIQKLAEQEAIQLGLFDERDLVELESADYPGERLIACRNPLVAASNQAKREDLLQETEQELEAIVAATKREKRSLRGAYKIGVRVGKILNKFKVGKFLDYEITDKSFSYSRKREAIEEAEALDGIYILRTSVSEKILSAP
ncbi:MAG: IS1634 family transposase, partial [Xenococcaceae cyanobacterium]